MFTNEDIKESGTCGLSPAYFDARRVASDFISKFESEQFKPLIDKLAEQVNERLWEELQASLLSDTESNLQGEMWRMVDNCVRALLGGEQWAFNQYVLGDRYDCEKIRAAVAQHIPVELQDERIADLKAKLEQAERDIAFYRNRR